MSNLENILNLSDKIENYFQIKAIFDTQDAMGANFINSCLEQFAKTFKNNFTEKNEIEIIMSILSNYVPECIVKAEVSCKVEKLSDTSIIDPFDFAHKSRRVRLGYRNATQSGYELKHRFSLHNILEPEGSRKQRSH